MHGEAAGPRLPRSRQAGGKGARGSIRPGGAGCAGRGTANSGTSMMAPTEQSQRIVAVLATYRDRATMLEAVLERLGAAVADGSPVTLVDDKGKKVLIPGAKLAYAEVSTEEPRRVGFLG